MLISYYANKKSSPRLPSWQPSLIFFNIPIESGTIIKPCTLKHFQVTYMLHKAGYWTMSISTPLAASHWLGTSLKSALCMNSIKPSYIIYISWTNAELQSAGPQQKPLLQWIAFENVVCKMVAILFRAQYMNLGCLSSQQCVIVIN